MQPIQTILILGGGSAGFTVALTLKRRLPGLALRVLRSRRLGVIGVGESTTPYLPAHYTRSWVHNVIGIGNASGFVEPLEATALMCLCLQCRALADGLVENDAVPTPSLVTMYNRYMAELWDEIRDFLSIHFKFNTRLDTSYWRRCRAEADLHGAAPLVEYYQENGPSVLARTVLLPRHSPFGIEGYYTLLVGQGRGGRRRKPGAHICGSMATGAQVRG